MVVVPTLTLVTNPVLLIEATEVLDETHGLVVAGVALPVNCVVKPKQTLKLPVIVGNGFTVMILVVWQLLLLVNVIVAVPAAIPETTPVAETVATEGLEETHGLVAAPAELAVRVIVCPAQTEEGPVIIGIGLTTNDWLALVVPHSLVTEWLIV